MRSLIEPKIKLQKHRKRRKVFTKPQNNIKSLSDIEMRIIKAYPTFGSMLDQMRIYGWREGVKNICSHPETFGIPLRGKELKEKDPFEIGRIA